MLPNSNNLHEYWHNLINGEDCLTRIPNENDQGKINVKGMIQFNEYDFYYKSF